MFILQLTLKPDCPVMLLLPVRFQKKCGSAAEVFRKLIGMLCMQHGAMLYSTKIKSDEMDLFEIKPDNIPTHISNHFAIFCPGGKRKS